MVRIRQLLLPLLIRSDEGRIRNPTRYQDTPGGQSMLILSSAHTDGTGIQGTSRS